MSLVGLLRGEPAPARAAIYWHYPHYHAAGVHGPAGAIRAGDWKLIEYYETTLTGKGAARELFNLRDDPAETRNLAPSEGGLVEALQVQLREWRQSVGAQMPVVNLKYDPAKASQSGSKSSD